MKNLHQIASEAGEKIEAAHEADTFGDYTGLGLIADFVAALRANGYEIVRVEHNS